MQGSGKLLRQIHGGVRYGDFNGLLKVPAVGSAYVYNLRVGSGIGVHIVAGAVGTCSHLIDKSNTFERTADFYDRCRLAHIAGRKGDTGFVFPPVKPGYTRAIVIPHVVPAPSAWNIVPVEM